MRPTFASLFVFAALLVAPVAAKALVVPINHSARLNIAGTASSVVVGNPTIADVTVVDSHTVYVMGKGYGSTDVVVLDARGRTLFTGDVTVSAAGGTVSVYRGAVKSNVACDPGCAETTELAGSQKTGAAAAPTALASLLSAAAAPAAAPAVAPNP
ncbi:MAG: pilus assembly protein N-terminal domain-containing protein [Caulobacteraceae bacterium]